MTTISGFADGILDGTIPPEEADKYLLSIRDETRRLSRLVRDMLDISQMKAKVAEPGRRVPFDLTELVLQTLLSFESRATMKNLDVDPQLPENHIMVIADRDAITQVIYNLLDNAVKFTESGCITLVFSARPEAYGLNLCVKVRDTGIGIAPEQSIGKFLGDPPRRYSPAGGAGKMECAIFEIDTETGRCLSAESLRII